MEIEDKFFFLSILFAVCIAYLVSLTSIWQLIIIAGIGAGILNKKMWKGTISGAIGVFLYYLIYALVGIISRNAYSLLDQFGALIVGAGFGWLIFLIILLVGTLFGALGGAIGSALYILIKPRVEKKILNPNKTNKASMNSKI